MLTNVILKRCFVRRCGLRNNLDRTIPPIIISKRLFMNGLEYVPSEESERKVKKKDQELSLILPELY